MTAAQRADLVLEGFNISKVLDEKSSWKDYFQLVADTVDAMKAGKGEEVQDLYKKVNLEFNGLNGAEEEDFFNQNRFLDKIAKYLQSKGLEASFE